MSVYIADNCIFGKLFGVCDNHIVLIIFCFHFIKIHGITPFAGTVCLFLNSSFITAKISIYQSKNKYRNKKKAVITACLSNIKGNDGSIILFNDVSRYSSFKGVLLIFISEYTLIEYKEAVIIGIIYINLLRFRSFFTSTVYNLYSSIFSSSSLPKSISLPTSLMLISLSFSILSKTFSKDGFLMSFSNFFDSLSSSTNTVH